MLSDEQRQRLAASPATAPPAVAAVASGVVAGSTAFISGAVASLTGALVTGERPAGLAVVRR